MSDINTHDHGLNEEQLENVAGGTDTASQKSVRADSIFKKPIIYWDGGEDWAAEMAEKWAKENEEARKQWAEQQKHLKENS